MPIPDHSNATVQQSLRGSHEENALYLDTDPPDPWDNQRNEEESEGASLPKKEGGHFSGEQSCKGEKGKSWTIV